MAQVSFDRIRDQSTTTGTGTLVLQNNAPTGYFSFASVMTVGDVCAYGIFGQGTGEWEIGVGTYSSANRLARTYVDSSSAGAKVSFSAGTKDVCIIHPSGMGRYIEATVASGSKMTLAASGQDQTLTSIQVFPGDWDIYGVVHYTADAATQLIDRAWCSISLNTGLLDLTSDAVNTVNMGAGFTPGAVALALSAGPVTRQMSFTAATNVYLISACGFSGGNCYAHGHIHARRVR